MQRRHLLKEEEKEETERLTQCGHVAAAAERAVEAVAEGAVEAVEEGGAEAVEEGGAVAEEDDVEVGALWRVGASAAPPQRGAQVRTRATRTRA